MEIYLYNINYLVISAKYIQTCNLYVYVLRIIKHLTDIITITVRVLIFKIISYNTDIYVYRNRDEQFHLLHAR